MKRLKAILGAFDKEDVPVLVLLIGLIMVGVGLSHFHEGLGLAISGLIILVYVRPLSRWFK